MNTEEVKSVLREAYKKRGYLVIAQPERVPRFYSVGETVTQVFEYDFGTEFEVTAESDRKDFDGQDDCIAELRPTWARLHDPRLPTMKFFRIKPLMRRELEKGA